MEKFDADEIFTILLEKIENEEIRTTKDLRLQLESLEEKFHIKQLLILVAFREWLLKKDIILSTENGIVSVQSNFDQL